MVSQQHALDLQADAQRTAYLTVSHLYVHDGDLAAQDRVAKEIAALTKSGDTDLAGVEASADDPAMKPLIARLRTARARFVSAYNTAVRRSRDETVRQDEERAGSRGFYAAQVVPAADGVTKTAAALTREVAAEVASSASANEATASSGTKTIIIGVLIAALAAAGLALVVVRSVVRPLKVVVERLAMLRDVCIAGLQQGIAAMASGDLTKPVEPSTPQIENPAGDEVGDVARAFNEIQA